MRMLFHKLALGAGVGLVAVHLRGVEGAVAGLKRGRNRVLQHLPLEGIGAEGPLVRFLEADVHGSSVAIECPWQVRETGNCLLMGCIATSNLITS